MSPRLGGTALHPSTALAWVLPLGADLRRSQAKPLAPLAAAALRGGRVSLADSGRELLGTTTAKPKHLARCASPAATRHVLQGHLASPMSASVSQSVD